VAVGDDDTTEVQMLEADSLDLAATSFCPEEPDGADIKVSLGAFA